MYVRKTRDEYEVQGLYAFGWEVVTTEDTWPEALQRVREYRENEPGYQFRVVKKRVSLSVG